MIAPTDPGGKPLEIGLLSTGFLPSLSCNLDGERYVPDRDRHAPYLGRAVFHGLMPSPHPERGEQFAFIFDQADGVSLGHGISTVRAKLRPLINMVSRSG